ncbi:Phenazine biosynthesis PhzF protein [Dillenia turbinata]|uniref:Phenazine biosynthesis PhzF protein n=1 Tax=Dillenia turbinata TaxID=194707 RepID=A0AAN8W7V9_9MAGN
MMKKAVRYAVVDAFTDAAFKGNPAGVCWLEEERETEWLQLVSREINAPCSCFLAPTSQPLSSLTPRFQLRWFAPVAEISLCGHATLAASHFLFTSGIVNTDTIEFSTLSGILTAKKLLDDHKSDASDTQNSREHENSSIELDFPIVPTVDYSSADVSLISKALNGVPMINIKQTTTAEDLMVELPSAKMVGDFKPQFDHIKKCPGRGLIITGAAPPESGFDFFSRVFFPKWGVNEDPVCGSAHCALVPYWSQKLGKRDFSAYQASLRGGILNLSLDNEKQRVLLRGKAVTVMEGSAFLISLNDLKARLHACVAGMIEAMKSSSSKRKGKVDADNVAVLNAWHRVDTRTREAFRRSFLSELLEGYEVLTLKVFVPLQFLECYRYGNEGHTVIEDDKDKEEEDRLQSPQHNLDRFLENVQGRNLVDAFTDAAFKGNPAGVCWLEEERETEWLQLVAREINAPCSCFLTPTSQPLSSPTPRFQLRWFAVVAEISLCGHATLAASHFLFTSGIVNTDTIEFSTLSGILTAKKLLDRHRSDASVTQNGRAHENFSIELDFPVVPTVDYNSADVSLISKALNGVPMIKIKQTTTAEDLMVELPSAKMVADFKPQFDHIKRCPCRGLIITGAAPPESGFDFFSRIFFPKLGVNEDPVCGSAHYALVPYWSQKLGKRDFSAYQASPRGGILNLSLDNEKQRVLLRGKAVTVMEGSVLA